MFVTMYIYLYELITGLFKPFYIFRAHLYLKALNGSPWYIDVSVVAYFWILKEPPLSGGSVCYLASG